MKTLRNIFTVVIANLLVAGAVAAQITPDIDMKGTAFINTDPILSTGPGGLDLQTAIAEYLSRIAIKTDPVLSPTGELAGFSLNFVPVKEGSSGLSVEFSDRNLIEKFSLNMGPVFQMVSLLEKSGNKVSVKLVQNDGLSHLVISVNGKTLEPIVFEYKNPNS